MVGTLPTFMEMGGCNIQEREKNESKEQLHPEVCYEGKDFISKTVLLAQAPGGPPLQAPQRGALRPTSATAGYRKSAPAPMPTIPANCHGEYFIRNVTGSSRNYKNLSRKKLPGEVVMISKGGEGGIIAISQKYDHGLLGIYL